MKDLQIFDTSGDMEEFAVRLASAAVRDGVDTGRPDGAALCVTFGETPTDCELKALRGFFSSSSPGDTVEVRESPGENTGDPKRFTMRIVTAEGRFNSLQKDLSMNMIRVLSMDQNPSLYRRLTLDSLSAYEAAYEVVIPVDDSPPKNKPWYQKFDRKQKKLRGR